MSEAVIHPRLFALTGGTLVLLALVWWYLIFGTAVQNGYGDYLQASRCVWGNDYLCTLLISLCTIDHPLIPRGYRPELFWIGAALIAGGAGAALHRRQCRQSQA